MVELRDHPVTHTHTQTNTYTFIYKYTTPQQTQITLTHFPCNLLFWLLPLRYKIYKKKLLFQYDINVNWLKLNSSNSFYYQSIFYFYYYLSRYFYLHYFYFIYILCASFFSHYPTGVYLFKVNNGNTWTICEICSKLTIKTRQQQIDIVLASLASTLNTFHILIPLHGNNPFVQS